MRVSACASATSPPLGERPAEAALAQVDDERAAAARPLLDDRVDAGVDFARELLPRAVLEVRARVRQAVGMMLGEIRLGDRGQGLAQVALQQFLGARPEFGGVFGR